ncbi:MAG: zinc dependent phospholipase C family protein [Deltaproteobacteria bacterium]|nr:zinc dependent phospholipase C family protein [Deltaproteobacteria bacterium]
MFFRSRRVRNVYVLDALLVAVGLLLFPLDAFAWGPVAHIDFGMQLLSGAAILAPALRRLLGRHPLDFIYGSLAADAVVGKNLADRADHCHDWDVARGLLSDAQGGGDHLRAFAYGYLTHLAADVVAHNHFVPERLIACYRTRGLGHLYWEARCDEKLLAMSPQTRGAWRDVSKLCFKEHDALLADRLVPTLFSTPLSTRIYRGALKIQRRGPWRAALGRIDARSRIPLSQDEIELWRGLSVEMARRALADPSGEELSRFDPTGIEALARAANKRKLLRRHFKRHGDTPDLRRMLDLGLADLPTAEEMRTAGLL